MLNHMAQNEIELLSKRYPVLKPLQSRVAACVELLTNCYRSGKKFLICGNGGSAADSLHIVGELMKSFAQKRCLPEALAKELSRRFPAEATYYLENLQAAIPCSSLVCETSLLTAFSNDCVAELVFAQQVLGNGSCGDTLLAISTSGNSANILHAARVAQAMGMRVVAMTGQTGGQLRELADILLNVPAELPYQVQEYHLPIYHAVCLALEAELFGHVEREEKECIS